MFQPGRIIRWFFVSIAVLLALVVAYAGSQIWQNNRSIDTPSSRAVADSLAKAIGWLMANREAVLGENNPMLWRFIRTSADITGDERLQALFSDYKKRHLDPYLKNVWWHLFDTQSKVPVMLWQFEHLPDYNLYFIYGATCDPVLGKQQIIQNQNDPAFCASYHSVSPACVTHQLMGVRLAQRRGCLDPHTAEQLVFALQEKIIKQLVWDPRVVDVYVQRVLMLAESGMSQKMGQRGFV